MSLQVDVREEKTHARLVVAGRLDGSTAPRLDGIVATLLKKPVSMVMFDFSDLEYISSAGLRVIFKAQKVLKTRHGSCALVNMQPQIRRVFEIVNALPDLTVFASYDEMDEYLTAMQRQVLENR